MTVTNEELNKIVLEKQTLIKDLDQKKIGQEEYDKQMVLLIDKEQNIKQQLIENENIVLDEKEKIQETINTELKTRTPRSNSYTTLIVEALMDENLNSLDLVINAVDEKKPGRVKKNLRNQIITIIRLVKTKTERWALFNWDEEKFLLEKN